jgi:type II secretory pathway component PulJ
MISNEKGSGLIEIMVAISLLSIGVLGLLAVQPQAWTNAARTDYMGRATGVLQNELESVEARIMNANIPLPSPLPNVDIKTAFTSGQPDSAHALPGDASYNVRTEISNTAITGLWLVRVSVTWPMNPQGISGSILVTRQDNFRF